VVETLETPEPTTLPLIPETTLITTTLVTTVPTTAKEEKPVICPSDRVKCDNKCVDLQTDSSNCGYCKTTCSSGLFCLNGQCIKSCSAGQTSCADGCFDLQYDAKHCGTCLNACPRGLICYRGQCTMPETPMAVPQ
jgi:Stigma-specific protein, Stig1